MDERSTGCLDRVFNEHIVTPRLQNNDSVACQYGSERVFSAFIECPLGTLALENDGLGQ